LPPELLLLAVVPLLLPVTCPLLDPDELPVTLPLLEPEPEVFPAPLLVVEPPLEALVFVVLWLAVAPAAGVCADPLLVLAGGGLFQGVDDVDVGPEHSQAPPASAATTHVGVIHPVFLIVTSSNRQALDALTRYRMVQPLVC
jgi:hypothetical protein